MCRPYSAAKATADTECHTRPPLFDLCPTLALCALRVLSAMSCHSNNRMLGAATDIPTLVIPAIGPSQLRRHVPELGSLTQLAMPPLSETAVWGSLR